MKCPSCLKEMYSPDVPYTNPITDHKMHYCQNLKCKFFGIQRWEIIMDVVLNLK